MVSRAKRCNGPEGKSPRIKCNPVLVGCARPNCGAGEFVMDSGNLAFLRMVFGNQAKNNPHAVKRRKVIFVRMLR